MELEWSQKIEVDRQDEMNSFIQQMINRLIQGFWRYGPVKDKSYMTKLHLEFKNYKKTGNRESLLNIANYAILESLCPENKKFHWNNKAGSVTRGKI